MASAWKTLGEAFPGRFVLGMGVSHAPMVEGVHRQTYTAPVATMREFLDAMDAAFYTAPLPDPLPPRVLAALGPRMLALAAQRTDGAHPYLVTPEHTAVARAALGDGPLLAPEQTVVLETDPGVCATWRGSSRARTCNSPTTRTTCSDSATRRKSSTTARTASSTRSSRGAMSTPSARACSAHHDAGADHVCVQVLPRERGEIPRQAWRELAPALLSA